MSDILIDQRWVAAWLCKKELDLYLEQVGDWWLGLSPEVQAVVERFPPNCLVRISCPDDYVRLYGDFLFTNQVVAIVCGYTSGTLSVKQSPDGETFDLPSADVEPVGYYSGLTPDFLRAYRVLTRKHGSVKTVRGGARSFFR